MRHGSLFSGIGGFDLAAEQIGWTNLFNCEIDEFCRRVLDYHFSDAYGYTDVKRADFREWRGKVDVLSGGFPCQPFSTAGKRLGTEDDRYLWPELLRAIDEIRPTWVVGENVAGLLSMVQPSEERQSYVLYGILEDLEERGYSVQTFIIPACAVGAPHRRDRVWIIAHSSSLGLERRNGKGERQIPETHLVSAQSIAGRWESFPTKSPICGGDDGIPRELDSLTFPKWRRESLKAYGNAIVPQIAYEIFRAIDEIEKNINA